MTEADVEPAFSASQAADPARPCAPDHGLPSNMSPAKTRSPIHRQIAWRVPLAAPTHASATIDAARDWLQGTPDGDWVSMAVRSDGSYGVPEGLIYSYPVTTEDGSWEIVQGLEIDDFSRGKMDATAAELADEREAVKGLGLI